MLYIVGTIGRRDYLQGLGEDRFLNHRRASLKRLMVRLYLQCVVLLPNTSPIFRFFFATHPSRSGRIRSRNLDTKPGPGVGPVAVGR